MEEKTKNVPRLLHNASLNGDVTALQELLRSNPSLTEELDPLDRTSPLHVACSNGRIELVRILVSANPTMCFARDIHGRTPAHVAVVKGHVDVLRELLWAMPAVARERVGPGGDNIMHMCVKYNQFEVLKLLASMVHVIDAHMLLNATDGDGNTVLHVAVADKRHQIVRFLVNDSRVENNKPNSNGLTAMDTFVQSNNDDQELRSILEEAKLLTSKKIKDKGIFDWVETQRNALMVVTSVIATIAFQAGINPPGGTFQEDKPLTISKFTHTLIMHRAGWAILAETDVTRYKNFMTLNTIALVSSMSSLLMLISGLRKGRFWTTVLMVMMWMAISAMTCNYGIALLAMAPYEVVIEVYDVLLMSLSMWASFMGILLLGHANAPWTRRLLEELRRLVERLWRRCFGNDNNNPVNPA